MKDKDVNKAGALKARLTRKGKTEDSPWLDQVVWPTQVIGGKYVQLLEKELQKLHDSDAHGNRKLHLNHLTIGYLLAFYNPIVRSLRTLEDFSQSAQVQKHLSIRKLCKSTLCDFNQLVDPERLGPIIQMLGRQLKVEQSKGPKAVDGELEEVLSKAIAVDGTFLPALADVSWAVVSSNQHRKRAKHRARVDVHLNVQSWIPEAIVVPEDSQSEADSAIARIQSGKLYIYDRGYMSFELVAAHYEVVDGTTQAKSDYVIRFKLPGANASELTNARELPLSPEDLSAGVISDRLGYFTSDSAGRAGLKEIQLREVNIRYQEDGKDKTLRLITSLKDISAANIGLVYQNRWQVELFFRWLKCFAGFGHLISHSRPGVLAHFYVTVIGVMLMYLHAGFRPSKYMFALMGQVAAGAATLEEIIPILRERERRCALDRKSAKLRAEKKKH
jgi:hypothetical protein